MDSSNEQGGARGAQYTDDHGELHDIEQGVESLGTVAAGAGVAGGEPAPPDDAPTAPRTLDNAEPPPVLFASDAGEQTAIEQGVQLTEVGAEQTGGSSETH
ncbi:MAG: hypothetical protein M3Z04_04735 [Chloroflexota bacterium]|nr:hypothetical protein [Chloroflexota bacterium]